MYPTSRFGHSLFAMALRHLPRWLAPVFAAVLYGTVATADGPDLVINSVSGPKIGTIGEQVDGFSTVSANQGTLAASAHRVIFVFSTDSEISPDDANENWGCNPTENAWNPGSTFHCHGEVLIPDHLRRGNYIIGAYTDSNRQVAEADETNNGRAGNLITLLPPSSFDLTGCNAECQSGYESCAVNCSGSQADLCYSVCSGSRSSCRGLCSTRNDLIANSFLGDLDRDGMGDFWESEHDLDPTDPRDNAQDFDHDGLINVAEYFANTDPRRRDSDGDGLNDSEDPEPLVPDPSRSASYPSRGGWRAVILSQ